MKFRHFMKFGNDYFMQNAAMPQAFTQHCSQLQHYVNVNVNVLFLQHAHTYDTEERGRHQSRHHGPHPLHFVGYQQHLASDPQFTLLNKQLMLCLPLAHVLLVFSGDSASENSPRTNTLQYYGFAM